MNELNKSVENLAHYQMDRYTYNTYKGEPK